MQKIKLYCNDIQLNTPSKKDLKIIFGKIDNGQAWELFGNDAKLALIRYRKWYKNYSAAQNNSPFLNVTQSMHCTKLLKMIKQSSRTTRLWIEES